MAKQRRHLGEIIYKAGLVDKPALIKAIKASKSNNKRLGEILVEQGLIGEEALTKCIAKQFGLEYIDLDTASISPDAAKAIPEELVRKHNVIPMEMNNGRLKIIVSDPTDLEMMDAIRFRLNTDPQCYLASPTKIRNYLEDSFDQTRKEEDDRLRHSIDATAAEYVRRGEFDRPLSGLFPTPVALAMNNEELAAAVRDALNSMMEDGCYQALMDEYGLLANTEPFVIRGPTD